MKQQFTDSADQVKIYEAIKNTNANIAVLATAGSGKTTVMLKGLNYIPRYKRSVFLSFSSGIVEELKTKVPDHVKAATLHSLGFSMMRRYYPGKQLQVVKDKYFAAAIEVFKARKDKPFLEKKEFRAAGLTAEVCNYARVTLTANTTEALTQMCIYYNIEFDREILSVAEILLNDALKVSKSPKMIIDFTDMIYFPAMISKMVDMHYDVIFLDEAQDTNAAQLAMLESLIAKGKSRLISVGDDYQCIYSFNGASIDAFEKIRNRPNTLILPLTVSYRCPKKVIEKAKTVCATIEAHSGAIEGEERIGHWNEIEEDDLVLSRTTKPLIALFFQLLDQGKKAKIIGKDIEKGLIELAEQCTSRSKEETTVKLYAKLDKLDVELRDQGIGASTLLDHPRHRAMVEKIQVIELILDKVIYTSEVVPTIKSIFDEEKKAARLMTIHRSKGLENDRVFVIQNMNNKALMPSPWATQPWENLQERNLQFVAYTRSKSELIHIDIE